MIASEKAKYKNVIITPKIDDKTNPAFKYCIDYSGFHSPIDFPTYIVVVSYNADGIIFIV